MKLEAIQIEYNKGQVLQKQVAVEYVPDDCFRIEDNLYFILHEDIDKLNHGVIIAYQDNSPIPMDKRLMKQSGKYLYVRKAFKGRNRLLYGVNSIIKALQNK